MLTDETLLSFAEAAKRLPRTNGRRVHASTVWRWSRKGLRGVRLEVLRLGGRFVTSLEALERFGQELAAADPVASAEMPTRARRSASESQRGREIRRAAEILEQAGI